jgi:hypothetical protein
MVILFNLVFAIQPPISYLIYVLVYLPKMKLKTKKLENQVPVPFVMVQFERGFDKVFVNVLIIYGAILPL